MAKLKVSGAMRSVTPGSRIVQSRPFDLFVIEMWPVSSQGPRCKASLGAL